MKSSNQIERIKLVKAMEYVARQINDELVFEGWLTDGVADGDVEYGDLDVNPSDLEEFEYYLEDKNFADLMDTFLWVMQRAKKSGGLYCDGVVSGRSEE